MDDLKALIELAVVDERPRTHAPELVVRTARRRQRGRRLGTAALALLIGALGTSLVLNAFEDRGVGRPATLDPSTLQPVWTAVVPEPNRIWAEPTFTDSSIVVPTTSGVAVYRRACSDPCTPAWTYTAEEGGARRGELTFVEIAAADGLVAVAIDGRLSVFWEACRDDGGECDPAWTATPDAASNGYRAPLIHNGVVRVVDSESEGGKHHVVVLGFPLACRVDGGECLPAWFGDMGFGTSYEPSAAVEGVFYKHVGLRMLGYTWDCATDGGECQPDFVIGSAGRERDGSGDLYGPLASDGVLVVTTGTGELIAYPEHCGTTCVPLWVGRASDWLDSPAMLAGENVAVASGESLIAFPIRCAAERGLCPPAWRADLPGPASLAYADDAFVVALARVANSTEVAVLPAGCSDPCQPIWSVSLDGRADAIASDGTSLFVASGRVIEAYPLACGTGCEPVWKGRAPGSVHRISIGPSGLVVGANKLGEVTLSAFEPA